MESNQKKWITGGWALRLKSLTPLPACPLLLNNGHVMTSGPITIPPLA